MEALPTPQKVQQSIPKLFKQLAKMSDIEITTAYIVGALALVLMLATVVIFVTVLYTKN